MARFDTCIRVAIRDVMMARVTRKPNCGGLWRVAKS